jgi:DNA-directed RNA polymerase specialized sigma subunit
MKENLIFGGAPNFGALKSDDRGVPNKPGTLSMEQMKQDKEKMDKEEEKKKNNKNKAPSKEEIREHLRMIIKYHKKEVEETMPSAYPLLGPAGKHSDDEDESGTNQSNSTSTADRTIRPYKERSGRKKQLQNVFDRQSSRKRGKK